MAHVLLVEDEPGQLAIRGMILQHAGHHVFEAASPSEALAHLASGAAVTVVTDIRLPRLEDGLRLLAAIPDGIPVIVLTGSNETGLDRLPIFRLLKKPCSSALLLEAITDSLDADGHRG